MNIYQKAKEFLIINKNKLIIFVSFVLVLIMFIIFSVVIYKMNKNNNSSELDQKESMNITQIEDEKEKSDTEFIFVDIKGYVSKPGVYEIESNKRVSDIIKLAGGLKKDANTRYLNLSKRLNDEMVIIIYSNKEIEEMLKKDELIIEKNECNCESITNDACINNTSNSDQEKSSELININTASLEELQNLSGIGESKAQAIIDYRTENGNFKNIEDIINVSGISESTYTKIKNFITV